MKKEMEKVATEAQAVLEQAEVAPKYLMESGIQEIVEKNFASDNYVFEVTGLVPKLQAIGRVALLQIDSQLLH